MSTRYDFDFISIGSGPAGQKAAVQAAKLGKRAAVIERDPRLGGVCLRKGTIPSKTLREAVLAFAHHSGRDPRRRMTGTTVPPSFEVLLERVEEIERLEGEVIEDQLRRNRVEIIQGEASFADSHRLKVTRADGESRIVSADFVLIAVGTRPAIPKGIAVDRVRVITSDDLRALKRIPRSLCVVGGGVIGIEYASIAANLDISVTLVEKRERPIDFADREIVDELMHQLRGRGVALRVGEAVAGIESNGAGARVHLDSGKAIDAEVVLISAGRTAVTESLELGAIGLGADERGYLQVDESFRTSVPNVFAAGDVIGYPSLASISMEQGRLAARNAFGMVGGKLPSHFPVGIYAIPELSFVGATERELTNQRIPYESGVARYGEIARGHILGDDTGYFKMLFHREDRRLLGVHAIGTGATELIHVGQAVLGLGGGLDYFLGTVFNYPTLAECYRTAALDAFNKLSH